MDPLSLTASIIAVIGLGGKTVASLAKLRAILHAKEELSALINEISDLQAVLTTLSAITIEEENNHVHLGPKKALASHIQRANDKIMELEKLIAYELTKVGRDGNVEAVRHAWLRKKHVAFRLQAELKTIRWNLATSLGMVTSSAVSRVEISVQRILCDQQAISGQLSYLLSRESPTARQNAHLEAESGRPSTPHRLFPDSSIARLDVGVHGAPLASIEESGDSVRRTIVVQTSTTYTKRSCNTWCSCVCHVKRSARTPMPFRRFFGALFVGYSGLPVITPACNERSCLNRARPVVQLDYYFPSWFLARILAISMSISPAVGIEGTLRMPRMVAWSSKIWRLARTGQLEAIQTMFSEGKASPFDVNAYGQSALHYATSYLHLDVCRFLIKHGAHRMLADENNVTPLDNAWNLLLSKELETEQAEEVATIFSDDDFMESRQFTILHKATLNIISRTIFAELESTTSALDAPDAMKRTPLSWAAARRDYAATRTLLDYGAKPNIVDSEKRPPLYYAVKNGDMSVVEVLLSHGAKADLRDAFGGTALHIACKNQDDVRLLDAITVKAPEVNIIDDDGDTPLMYASRRNHWRSAIYLIKKGAALDLVNVCGDSAMAHAIFTYSHDVLRELLKAGASTSVKNNAGETMMDLALASRDPLIIEIFRTTGPPSPSDQMVEDTEDAANEMFYEAVQEQDAITT